MNELALFAGAGGGILGGHLLGWRTVCAVEREPYAASVLAARQNDCFLPAFPIWDDVCTFDGRPWRGVVDVVSGGFPCQDISAAGKGAGIDGERSGLWGQMARIVGEVRPRFVFVENSPLLVGRGLVRVLADLAEMGFDARWGVVGADDVGAPHRRERCWIVANANGLRELQPQGSQRDQRGRTGNGGAEVSDANSIRQQREQRENDPWQTSSISRCCKDACNTNGARLALRKGQPSDDGTELAAVLGADWWAVEPELGRVADGVAARVDRLKAIGNGQVPQCAAEAWRLLTANKD
jgi:DNA (cytosine-5)-methyltransferase 1